MKSNKKMSLAKKMLTGVLLITISTAAGTKVHAVAFDPNEDYKNIGLRFWEDKKPGVDFYLNASNRYLIETVKNPTVQSVGGEWSVMDLLRGMYTEADYINHIPESYFENYINTVENYIIEKGGRLDRNKITEWNRLTLTLTPLNYNIKNVSENNYDFIQKFSESFAFTKRQGINGPIWTLIALNTGNYELYPNTENKADWNTEGKMIDHILSLEIIEADGSIGGWALTGKKPDPDITGMALQAFAPYYLSKEKYEQAGASRTHEEFKAAVERAILKLQKIQKPNGGYDSWGSLNSESIVQVITALTALGFDPLADNIYLPTVKQNVNFKTTGGSADGVTTNNMIDALLTFWANGSGSSPEVSGFKHVTAGYDGGGNSGTTVNGMATDQASYGLIAYDRFLNNKNTLYDMMDQKETSYKSFAAKELKVTYDYQGLSENVINTNHYLAVEEIESAKDLSGRVFKEWNTKADGTGISYVSGEKLSLPKQDISLFAQYEATKYDLKLNLNDGDLSIEMPEIYTVDDQINLPNQETITKDGYIFEGWFTNSDFNGDPVITINKGTTGSQVFFAKWREMEDQDYANVVIEKINEIGEVTLEKENYIKEVRSNFEKLTDARKELVSNINTLETAEQQIKDIKDTNKALEIDQKIDTIGEVTLEKLTTIYNIRENYQGLTEAQQSKVEKLDILELAESEIINLQGEKASEFVENLIKELPIEITTDVKVQIEIARIYFDKLTAEQQTKVENRQELFEAESILKGSIEIDKQNAEKVIGLIKNLNQIDLNSGEKISIAESEYNKLSDYAKSLVNEAFGGDVEDNIADAKKEFKKLEAAKAKGDELTDKINNLNVDNITSDSEEIGRVYAEYNKAIKENVAVKNYVSNESFVKLNNANTKFEQAKADEEVKAKEVENLIDELILGKKDVTEKVTNSDNIKAVQKARESYDKLTTYGKNKVTNLSTLQSAEKSVKAINEVIKMIDALPVEAKLTLKDKSKLTKAKLAYDGLSEVEKKEVTNVDKLKKLEAKMKKLEDGAKKPDPTLKPEPDPETGKEKPDPFELKKEVSHVINLINDLPEEKDLKLSDKEKVEEARKAFNKLSENDKKLVSNLEKLEDLEAKMANLSAKGTSGNGTGTSNAKKPSIGTSPRNTKATTNKKPLPKTGEVDNSMLAGLGTMIMGSVFFWRRKK